MNLVRRPLPRGKRRGTVIVLALAVLAILAIAAVAYVSVVRIDRESAAAISQRANYEQQVNAVVSHIGGLLAADLFGNKIVTNAVPQTLRGGVRVWPRAFEDSESWDYPTSDVFWRNPAQTTEDQPLDPSNINIDRRVARPDDAWLAALEPRWNYSNLENTRYWPQISNLRSAYTWNQRTNQWERGDGRFVDLLQWFLQPRNGRANPAINLGETGNGNVAMGPEFGFDNGNDSRLTGVFNTQMAELDFADPASAPREALEPSDERMWADADGDLKPDARWQQLDALGNLYGLNWVVAARIIDASALVNVQTAIEFPYEANFGIPSAPSFGRQFVDVMGTGRSPADVDLLRLMSYANVNYPGETDVRPGIFDADISINQIDDQFEEHLRLSLGVESVVNDLREVNGTYPDDTAFQTDPKQQYANWERSNPLTTVQREALFSYATSTIERPVAPAATSYPRRDMLDLFSFYATNNANVLSKLEQRFDGPETNQGYLPDADSSAAVSAFGPMRSAERTDEIRRFDGGVANSSPEPSAQRIKMDIRRLLTMVSGVGQISPVPVINDAIRNRTDSFDSLYSQQKIRLGQLAGLNPGRVADRNLVQRVFGSLVWALAPLATNQPLMPGVVANTTANAAVPDSSAHYGGGILADSPAYLTQQARLGSPPINAAYAVARAASMTVNLLDAMDTDGSSTQPVPSAIRLYNNVEGAASPTGFYVDTRLTHGDIPPALLPTAYLGDATGGTTFFGVDRQPFLRQAYALAVYQNDDFVSGEAPDVLVDGGDPRHHLGSIIAFEIGNPWSEALDLSQYRVRLQTSAAEWLEFDLSSVVNPPEGNDFGVPTVQPGDRIVFYWQATNPDFNLAPNVTWEKILTSGGNSWRNRMNAAGVVTIQLNRAGLNVSGTPFDPANDDSIPFQAFGGSLEAPFLLVRKQTGSMPSEVIVDRMTPPVGNGTRFPGILEAARSYPVLAIPGYSGTETGCARVAVESSFSRPITNADGFPGYVIERRQSNSLSSNTATPIEQVWFVDDSMGVADWVAENTLDTSALLTLGTDVGSIPAVPFQLFVPNRPLEYLSELLLVSPFCHTYVHRDINGAINTGNPVLTDAWDMAPTKVNPWTTFSEYLGSDWEFYVDAPSNSRVNRYLGLLDPSRYVLNGPNMFYNGRDIPDALTVPLALRIVEPFDALSPRTDGTLVQGRININTAPPEVVACLPLVAPQYPVFVGSASGGLDAVTDAIDPVNGRPAPFSRVATFFRYRDRIGVNDNPDASLSFQQPSQADLTGIVGLRGYPSAGNLYSNSLIPRGLTTTAELAILQPWDPTIYGNLDTTVASSPALASQYFLQVGGDASNTSNNAAAGTINQLDTYNPSYGGTSLVGGTLDVIDDPEERLAIYRAISNIVSTRSDVYIAWFILRGYDPDIIEGITVDGGNSPTLQQAQDAMNGTSGAADAFPLTPTYESRWLVVYDRSNCVKPSDRPRILMQVELPPAKP